MKFKKGNFYMEATGRMIAVLEQVKSYAWGKMLVVEECIPCKGGIEHYISVIVLDSVGKEGDWAEVGKAEWMTNFVKGGNV